MIDFKLARYLLCFSMVIIMGLFSIFGCKGLTPRVEKIEYNDFTIVRKTMYSSRYDINTASRRDNSRSSYQIYFQDQKIEIPGTNAQKNQKIWKVFVLEDAPGPALIVANQSVFLISLNKGKVGIKKLAGVDSGFLKLQWLGDSHKPFEEAFEIYQSDDSGKGIAFSDGKYLMLHKQGILDVSALSYHPFQENISNIKGYSTYNIIALSPDENQIVFMGHSYDKQDQYALISYSYHTGVIELLPFNRNDTRLHEPYESDVEWLNSYFEWVKKGDSDMRLGLKMWEQPPPWTGHFTKDLAYSIRPVNKKMLEVFIDFLLANGYASDSEIIPDLSGMENRYEINKNSCRISLDFLDRINAVYLSPHFSEKKLDQTSKIIRQFGRAFNETLEERLHQELFNAY